MVCLRHNIEKESVETMSLSGGEIAGLIAAIAFAIFSISLAVTIYRAGNVVKEMNTTVEEVNETITVLTKNTDHLLVEVEGLLNKSNTTLDDVNGKLTMTDPLFKAVGDLGESVSDLNYATKKLTGQLSNQSKAGARLGMSKKIGEKVAKL